MNVSGTSGASSVYYTTTSVRLHSPGCTCSLCSPTPVDTSSPTADIQSQEGKTQLTQVGKQLSADEQVQVDKLKARDREVRQHEQAHLAAAGGLTISGPSFSYQRGPDGVNYAIGGEVSIDTSPGNTPEETLRKARQIERAALAPKDPSSPDRSVASRARQMAQEAQLQLAEQPESASGKGEESDTADKPSGATTAGNRAQQAYQTQQDGNVNYTSISAYA